MTQISTRLFWAFWLSLASLAASAFLPHAVFAAETADPCKDYLLSDRTLAYELSVACVVEGKYGHIIEPVAYMHEYDKNLITAVIVVESRGKPTATSHVGAKGLMQLMPATAKYMGAKDIRDPFENILAGTKYLRALEDHYGFLSVEEALLAYNMGPRKAAEWLDASGRSATDASYVKKVMGIYHELRTEEERRKAEEEKDAAEELLQNLLLKITKRIENPSVPELLSARRLGIETREED